MPDHFTDIGFRIGRPEDIGPLVVKAANLGQRVQSPNGWYSMWSPGRGIEMWVAMENSGEILGCNPFFAGEGRVDIRLESLATEPPAYTPPMEGGVEGWAAAVPGDPGSGLCPVLVDLPDFDLVRGTLGIPSHLTLRVSAFAHWIRCYVSDSEFDAAQARERHKYAPEFFIPSGLFTSKEDPQAQPRAYALFAGHVMSEKLVKNPDTGLKFHHILARTAAGLFDVVSDPAAMMTGKPKRGGVVMGEYWLSGRIAPPGSH